MISQTSIPSRQFAAEECNAQLAHEGRFIKAVAAACTRSFGTLIARGRTEPRRVLEWWAANKGMPREYQKLENRIRTGDQPVFCNISLCLPSRAPTLIVPVPFVLNSEKSRDTFQVLPEAGETAARPFCHALANLAYSTRIEDKPPLGWIARSHLSGKPLYLPDVLDPNVVDARGTEGARSAATREERFLAMASVLYIPVPHSVARFVDLPSGRCAGAVLMLWSPIPDRWPLLRDQTSIPALKHEHFEWLQNGIDAIQDLETRADSQFLGIMQMFDRWCRDMGSFGETARQSFLHGIPDLDDSIFVSGSPTPISTIASLVDLGSARSLIRHLDNQGPDLSRVPVELTVWTASGTATSAMATLGTFGKISRYFPLSATLRTSSEVTEKLCREAVSSIDLKRSTLKGVSIELSTMFCELSFTIKPTTAASKRLLDSTESFKHYFASRRGLIVPPDEPQRYGLGLSMYTRFAARLGAYRRLYVSPDGKEWKVVLAIPLANS